MSNFDIGLQLFLHYEDQQNPLFSGPNPNPNPDPNPRPNPNSNPNPKPRTSRVR